MTDKLRMIPLTLLDTGAFASGVEASGTIGVAGDGFVYEIQNVYTELTLGSDAGVRTPSIEVVDPSDNVIFSAGVANSGISKPSQTNRISAGMNLTSRAYGGGESAFDHQNIQLPSSDEGGMLVGGGTAVRTITVGLDATGNSDTYGALIVYGRRFKQIK